MAVEGEEKDAKIDKKYKYYGGNKIRHNLIKKSAGKFLKRSLVYSILKARLLPNIFPKAFTILLTPLRIYYLLFINAWILLLDRRNFVSFYFIYIFPVLPRAWKRSARRHCFEYNLTYGASFIHCLKFI